ncbi:guanylate cyclase activator 1g [Syngnathus scovelli]|uniref:guanylate cyclase activator 1g n=1 Tax=Syngnathus scovelli TaxID=161590 RepID=UPI0035CA0710
MGQEESHSEEIDLAQIQELCISFMKECPSGALHLHEFKRIFGVPSNSAEESLFIETIFRSFDTNQDNTLDFLEYVAALHLILRGNFEDRLKWSFKMYGKDGNGKLDGQEVKRIIRILYKIKLQRTDVDLTPSEICDRIFELGDRNSDGHISLTEFMEGAQKDEWVMNLLNLDVNAVRVFQVIFIVGLCWSATGNKYLTLSSLSQGHKTSPDMFRLEGKGFSQPTHTPTLFLLINMPLQEGDLSDFIPVASDLSTCRCLKELACLPCGSCKISWSEQISNILVPKPGTLIPIIWLTEDDALYTVDGPASTSRTW